MQESSIQKLCSQELVQYLEQRDLAYLQMQCPFWETVFQQVLSGLYNEMNGTLQQSQYLRALSEMYCIVGHLSPGSKFFEQMISFDTLYAIPNELFPPHIQLFLQESSIQQQNPVFGNFASTFQDNIQKGKIKLTPYMVFWVFALRTLHREPVKRPMSINQLPFREPVFVSLTHNPNLILIRKHLSYIQEQITAQQHQRNFWLQLFTKMITLLREFTLYQCLFQLIPNELKLS